MNYKNRIMSNFISSLIKVSNRSCNKKYKMAAGLIRNNKLVSVSFNGLGIYSHAETNVIRNYFKNNSWKKVAW